MNVFKREISSYRRSTMIWIVSLSSIAVIFLLMFPAFSSDIKTVEKALSAIPQLMRDVANLSLTNFFTIFGFFGYILTFVTLAGAIQAMNLGVNIISKEESGKTADFLFSKPISRIKVLTSKIAASIWLLIATNIMFSFVALTAAILISSEGFSAVTFLLISITLIFVQLIFLSLGILFGTAVPKIKSAISVTLPTVFSFFIIGSLGSVIGSETARDLSPLKYFETDFIIKNNSYELKYLIIGALIIIISILISYAIFIKKDIQAAA